MKISYDVPTSELQAGDIVIRNDEAQCFVSYVATPFSEYGELTWCEPGNDRVTWTSTAQPWNTWPIVVRES